MNADEIEYVENIYYDPNIAGSFSGPYKLYKFIQKDGKFNISLKKITKWIQSQEVYTTNRLVKQKIKRRKVIVPYIDYMWDIDTASLKDYSKDNDNFGYFLLIIDIMSRFIWTHPIKTPSGLEVKKVLHDIFNTTRVPEKIRTDKGTEFSNKVIQKLFKSYNIDHFVTQNEVKANYAERGIQSIKGRIMRYLRSRQSHRWVDELSSITNSYNNTFHISINQSPASVTKKDENKLWEILYQKPSHPNIKKTIFKFEIGAFVRISKLRKTFQRYYSEHWTNEVFIIKHRSFKQYIPTYELSDYADEAIIGIFYENELQTVYVDENTVYNIEKVIKTRNKKSESLIKWMGWPTKFNSWIPTEDIQSYK